MQKILPNRHLVGIHRDSERNLGRKGLMRLDRNERVTPLAEAVFRDMLGRLTIEDVTGYPDSWPFVERVARLTRLTGDHVSVTPGSDGGIRRIFQAYIGPGDVILTAEPTYAMYGVYTTIFQGVSRKFTYAEDLSLDVDGFIEAIEPGVRMVALANPGQPSSTVISRPDLTRIVAKAAEVGALCVVDEAYYPYHPETAADLVRDFDNLLVVRSFSKLPGMAGLRLGYVLGHSDLLRPIETVRGNNEVSQVSLVFGSYMLDHPEMAEQFHRLVEEGRALLIEAGRKLGFTAPHCVANFQLLRVTRDDDAAAIASALKKRGVLIKAAFPHPGLIDCLRVSVNGPETMGAFAQVLSEVVAELRAAGKER